MKLTEEELFSVRAGASWRLIAGAGAAIISFVIGMIDGYVRPKACHYRIK